MTGSPSARSLAAVPNNPLGAQPLPLLVFENAIIPWVIALRRPLPATREPGEYAELHLRQLFAIDSALMIR
jgi:hypothetical protein